MTNYYIADPHFGHAPIIEHANRPFECVEEMDRTLIANWNARVHKNDHVYVIGDFAFRNAEPITNYLKQLKGIKHLLIGNHDAKWMKEPGALDYFESVDHMVEIIDAQYGKILLCHYPMVVFPCRTHHHIYGHIHGGKNDSYWPLIEKNPKALNASVEINGYMPVPFLELVANNKSWRAERPGRISGR